MKKKTYKRLINRIGQERKKYLREKFDRAIAEADAGEAKIKLQHYKRRFSEIGSHVQTIDPGEGKIKKLEWTVTPEQWGQYMRTFPDVDVNEKKDLLLHELARRIGEMLIEENIMQIIIREPMKLGPLDELGTFGGKLYVVPWEQMTDKKQVSIVRPVIEELVRAEEQEQ